MDLSKIPAPDLEKMPPEDGWIPIEMPFSASGGASFVDGDPQGDRLRIRMFVRESDCRLRSKVWFGPQAEGPPGHAHGGSQAAVLDHTMGVGAWVAGFPVLAASITVDFRRKLPLGRVLTVETWVSRRAGKKVLTAGRIYDGDFEKPYSTGKGIFILQSLESFTELAGHGDDLKGRMKEVPVEPAD